MSIISKNIKAQRMKHHLSQEGLARQLFVTRQTISNYENGRSNPNIETLLKLAAIFKTHINYLIYGDKEPVS